jgi:uncharacterized protein (UPF0335 family)
VTDPNAQLRSIRERWERLEEDKKAIGDDLKELFAEAKSNGFDPKALRLAFRTLAKDENETEADKATRETAELYMAAILGSPSHTQARDAREGRDERRKSRMDESMADHVEQSAELAALGKISEDAHKENVAIAAAMINKFGKGLKLDSFPPDHKMHVRGKDGLSHEVTYSEFYARLQQQGAAA